MDWVDSIKSVDGGRIKWYHADSGIRLSLDAGARTKPRCVPHTTESSVRPTYAPGVRPHIDVGPDRRGGRSKIVQYVPFGYSATALRNPAGGIETNRLVLCQIEQIQFTARELWLPPNEMVVQMASIAMFLEEELGIPRAYPYDPRDMASGIWAIEANPWRQSGRFVKRKGWHPHASVPENSHWDCGGERIPHILRLAEPEPPPVMVEAFQLMSAWHSERTQHRESVKLSPHFHSKNRARRFFIQHPGFMWKQIRMGRRIYMAHRQVESSKVHD